MWKVNKTKFLNVLFAQTRPSSQVSPISRGLRFIKHSPPKLGHSGNRWRNFFKGVVEEVEDLHILKIGLKWRHKFVDFSPFLLTFTYFHSNMLIKKWPLMFLQLTGLSLSKHIRFDKTHHIKLKSVPLSNVIWIHVNLIRVKNQFYYTMGSRFGPNRPEIEYREGLSIYPTPGPDNETLVYDFLEYWFVLLYVY